MDLKKTGWKLGMSQSDSEEEQMAGSYKHENQATGSIKCVDFLYWFWNCKLIKKTLVHGFIYLFGYFVSQITTTSINNRPYESYYSVRKPNTTFKIVNS